MKRVVIAFAALTITAPSWAADLPDQAPAYEAPAAMMVHNWTGFYIGGHAGAQWLRSDNSFIFPAPGINGSDTLTDTAFIGGGQIGYNWQGQGSPWVLGIEADISGTSLDTTEELWRAGALHFDGTSKLGTQGSIRGRVGWASDAWLLYAAGGVSFGDAELVTTFANDAVPISTSFSRSKTLTGWNIGGGVEYAFTPSWSLAAEYRYTDFGDISLTAPALVVGNRVPIPYTADADFKTHAVTARLNYKFGGM